ncbi:MAG: RNA polymerase sigma factor [Marinicellaceae bacterium]
MHEIDDIILRQAIHGDKMAFKSIVIHYSKPVNLLAFRYAANKSCAEDITQDTFIKAYKALSKYTSQAKFSTWLFRIASNTSIDYLRKTKKYKNTDSIEQNIYLENKQDEKINQEDQLDINRQLQTALTGLSDVERLAFTLKHHQGYSINEISKKLNINNNACKQTIYRAVQKLRNKLRPMVNS